MMTIKTVLLTVSTALLLTQAHAASVQLRTGVLIDLDEGRIYLMSPDNVIEAANLDDGATIWRSEAIGRPLAVSGDLLLIQAEIGGRTQQLELLGLSVETGERQTSTMIDLPAGVQVSATNTLSTRFSAQAVPLGQQLFIIWTYMTIPMRGMPDLDEEQQVRQLPPSQGALMYDLTSQESVVLQPGAMPPAVQNVLQPAAGRVLQSNERLSIDGRHILRSEVTADNRTWDRYRWTIIENETGREIGSLQSHLAQAAFAVYDTNIITEVGPYARRIDNQMNEQPLTVRMVDLTTGQLLWSKAVRDTAYRGPFPP